MLPPSHQYFNIIITENFYRCIIKKILVLNKFSNYFPYLIALFPSKISKHPCSFCAVRHGDASFCLLSSPQPERTPLPIFLSAMRFLYPIFILLSTSPLSDRTTVFYGDMPHNSCDNAMPSRNLSSPHRGKTDDYLLAYLSAIAACAAASLAIGTR